jgi:hypothetical protein
MPENHMPDLGPKLGEHPKIGGLLTTRQWNRDIDDRGTIVPAGIAAVLMAEKMYAEYVPISWAWPYA